MARNYLVLLFVGCCVLFLQPGCQEQDMPAEQLSAEPQKAVSDSSANVKAELKEGSLPAITFETTTIDFGEVGAAASKKVAEFKFTNTGKGILKIKEVERCCGVVAAVDKDEIAPGDSGVVKAEFTTPSKPILFAKNIYVNSNDESKPRVPLTIKVKVVSKISCEPKRVRLFLDEENAGCPKIVLNSLDNKPFSITRFSSTGESISADIDSSVEATKFVLSPKVDIEKLNDSPKGRISINLNHPEEKTAEIQFDMLPKFVSEPPLIINFNVVPEKPIVRKISILNQYGGTFEIESISSPNNTIKVLEQSKIGDGYQLLVEMTPPASGGKTFFTDVVVVKIKGGNVLNIVWRGFYKQ
ncbi:MAG: DUF1573 domain-containing protein [Sedimentisphaerales bacterium]|nr:DUF1573 domain-containing protein [Sedimentisphaerales bacterium]